MMQLWTRVDPWLSFSPSLWPVLVFYCHGRSKFSAATMSRIQISNTLLVIAGMLVKPFIAVLVLYSSEGSSAMGSALYWMGMDVHGPRYGWSMHQASAILLVPDNYLPPLWVLIGQNAVWSIFTADLYPLQVQKGNRMKFNTQDSFIIKPTYSTFISHRHITSHTCHYVAIGFNFQNQKNWSKNPMCL